MLNKILNVLFGSKYERDLKRLQPIVEQINALEPDIKKLSDSELQEQTNKFKQRLEAKESLDDILPEAFATVREASIRTLGMRHFDVQLMGGISLHWGNIAEMKTGEGKTLTSTLPIYLNALTGKGVHVVTVNDYLAKRDANWMRPVYEFLGITIGAIQHDMDHEERQAAYGSDITYGTNNEFGFDYLRDNMVAHISHKVQRKHYYCIIDEVDSILIDEARTPLIISGSTDNTTDIYEKVDKVIPYLHGKEEFDVPEPKKGEEPMPESEKEWDYEIDEKAKNALLTEKGVASVENALGIENLYSPENTEIVHHVSQALKAHKLYKKDVDYVVQQDEVVIVDEFTGRLMEGRRYSDGLHQAIEAKERVPIARESQTLASITFQNFFRIYDKLSGMTGTADTEAEEFAKIYKLDVIVIPPNLKLKRLDHPDRVYRTEREKFDAIVKEIRDCQERKQPALVGTISIEKSEVLSMLLRREGLPHNVLNAKFHEKEAEIVANAGKPGSITIATNMAGRGTDIVLGGAPTYKEELDEWEEPDESIQKFKLAVKRLEFSVADGLLIAFPSKSKQKIGKSILDDAKRWKENHDIVLEAGGLHILGTERHESRRIDNQLRGRSGRQGDPGSSRFYLSLEDDLMRIFGSDRISAIMQRLGMEEGQEIEHKMVSNAIARSQKRVEAHNFDIRKHLLEYDDVMNRQRMFIYELRNYVLEGTKDISEIMNVWMEEVIETQVLANCEGNNPNAWNTELLNEWIGSMNITTFVEVEQLKKGKDAQSELFHLILENFKAVYEKKSNAIGLDVWKQLEKQILLDILDHRWKDHLHIMDTLREGIWTVGYSEKNPLIEYKIQGFQIFDQMVDSFKQEIIAFLFKVELTEEGQEKILEEDTEYIPIGEEVHNVDIFNEAVATGAQPYTRVSQKKDREVTTSAGGASKRKKKRKKRR
ncbi:MAG: preprotein translocase subunit SecA [Spirochaetota bacterium]